MTIRTTLTAIFALTTAPAVLGTEPATPVTTPAAEPTGLTAYTTPLETMFAIVEQINAHLASAQDEDTAEAAGDAIQVLLQPLDEAAVAFSKLPAPAPELQAELDAWFAEREHTMETMVQEVERLQNEDPAFYGSQTLITAIVYIGGILGGAQ